MGCKSHSQMTQPDQRYFFLPDLTRMFRTSSKITYLLAGRHTIRTYMSEGVRQFQRGTRHRKWRDKSLIKLYQAEIGNLSPIVNLYILYFSTTKHDYIGDRGCTRPYMYGVVSRIQHFSRNGAWCGSLVVTCLTDLVPLVDDALTRPRARSRGTFLNLKLNLKNPSIGYNTI